MICCSFDIHFRSGLDHRREDFSGDLHTVSLGTFVGGVVDVVKYVIGQYVANEEVQDVNQLHSGLCQVWLRVGFATLPPLKVEVFQRFTRLNKGSCHIVWRILLPIFHGSGICFRLDLHQLPEFYNTGAS